MKYRHLGKTGLKVSEICLGNWTTMGGTVDDETARKIAHKAWEAGINFFDTADVYAGGKAETVIGAILKDFPREQVVLATKVRGRMWEGANGEGLSRKRIMACVEMSLKRLRMDYIDIYQLHWPDLETPIQETMEALDILVRQGKVLYIGCSNYSTEQVREALQCCDRFGLTRFVSHQPVYNMFNRGIEESLMKYCAMEGVGFIVYSPLAQGLLTSKYLSGKAPEGSRGFGNENWEKNLLTSANLAAMEKLNALARRKGIALSQLALAWILRHPEIASCIIGASRPDQVEENAAAVEVEITDEEMKEIEGILQDRARVS
ncbi:MAG: aldo/keto reductase family protein [Armatimonadetes bacterium]|nr:aldo/keto reductase family protein [Armatimonadota bacterium]